MWYHKDVIEMYGDKSQFVRIKNSDCESQMVQNLGWTDLGDNLPERLGYTDHSTAHTKLVAEKGADILKAFEYGQDEIKLVKIAGFMHDIGNAINRHHHAKNPGCAVLAEGKWTESFTTTNISWRYQGYEKRKYQVYRSYGHNNGRS